MNITDGRTSKCLVMYKWETRQHPAERPEPGLDRRRVAGVARGVGQFLLDWRPLLLMVLACLGLLLVFQLPISYRFQIGLDRGSGTDRPFLSGFRDAELITWEESWRWTQPEAALQVPGVGDRPLLLAFTVLSHRQHWQPGAPPTRLTITPGASLPISLSLRFEPARYMLYLPATAVRDGTLQLGLSTAGWQNPSDPRGALGVAIGRQLSLDSVPGTGLVWPGSTLLLAYPAALGLLWLALGVLGFERRQALQLLLGLLALLVLLALVTPPRVAFSSRWALEAALLALVTSGVSVLLLPPLLRRLGVMPDRATLAWLLLLVSLTFTLKYGGQLHPVAMPGDLQLHINRFSFTTWGQVYIPAQHRGLPFPFPNGWYILLAPLLLTGLPLGMLFEVTAALAEAASVVLFYLLLTRLTGSVRGGLLGGLIYALSPIPMMNVWWSFQTQLGTQLLTLGLLCLIILGWPNYRRSLAWGWLVVLLILVSLGHIGAFINMGLVGLLAIPWLWLRARNAEERAGVRQLLLAGLLAAAFVVGFYYSGFAVMISAQVSGVAQEGMLAVTEREPLVREVWLRALWLEGFLGLNGYFLLPLGIAGAVLISLTPRYRTTPLVPLLWLTFAVGLSQAILPLITLSTITTRWLTFAGWGLTLGTAIIALRYVRRGWAGRTVVGLVLAYVAWVSLEVWIRAMVLNQPPLEPF